MTAQRATPLLSWSLGLLTLVALLFNLPQNLSAVLGLWTLFVLLIISALNSGVLLTSGEIHPAHLFSIMAFLALPVAGRPSIGEALWAVGVGSLIGALIQVALQDEWLPRRRVSARGLEVVAEVMAQQTLSLLAGSVVYLQLGGRLPLGRLQFEDSAPLGGFIITYGLIYLLLFTLRVRLQGEQISQVFARNWRTLLGVLVLPVPFAILGAVVINQLDPLSRAIMFVGLVLAVGGIYVLSRIQYRAQQQIEDLSSLTVVSNALRTSLELDALLQTIYAQVSGLLNVDNFTVALYDPTRDELRFPLAYRHGQQLRLPPRPLGDLLLDYVVRQRRSLLIERDVPAGAAALGLTPPLEAAYSWLGVPILSAERTLGAMAVFSGDPERLLSDVDERLMMNVAGQAGIAIESAQLFQQAQNRAQQLATLNNISALLTGSLSLEKVINLITSASAAVSGCDAVALYLYEGMDLTLVRNTGLSEAFSEQPPRPVLAENLAEADVGRLSRQPVIVTNVAEAQLSPELLRVAGRENKRAWMEWLLVTTDMPLGVVVVYYEAPQTFSGEAIELMRNFVTLASLALNNARRYRSIDFALERRVQHMQALFAISQELITLLDLPAIFEHVLERALKGTGSDSGLLALGSEGGASGIHVAVSRGYPDGALDDPLVIGGSVTAQVYDTGRPLLLANVVQHREYMALNPLTASQLSVPIVHENETVGVITLESQRPNAFDDDDINFMINLTAYAALAISNALLFERVQQGRDRLRVILDSMTEGVLLINREGRVEMANPQVRILTGMPPGQVEGRLVDELVQDTGSLFAFSLGFAVGDLRVLLADLRAGDMAETALSPYSYELSEAQHLHVRRQIAPVHDENGALLGLLLVFVDETEQRELDQAREDLTRMIVHDLRSPMTAVTASLKLLNDIVPAASDFAPIVRRTTDASMRAVRKLLNLVDSLLDIAKMESGQMVLDREPSHLNAVASNVILEMESLAHELDVTLAADIPFDLPLLDIDDEKIERVLLNLVDNALKFTPTGGRVEISARLLPGAAGPAVSLAENGAHDPAWVRVQVSDNGPGVPDDYKERLFNRFVQVEGQRGRRRGTGLGLTFCRLAVEAHGGRIWIEDNPAGGSVFAFTAPVADVAPNEEDDLLFSDDELAAPLL